jgi:hypothetical protein
MDRGRQTARKGERERESERLKRATIIITIVGERMDE